MKACKVLDFEMAAFTVFEGEFAEVRVAVGKND
jgi:hypothetical protein